MTRVMVGLNREKSERCLAYFRIFIRAPLSDREI
jgi:hypothetical protein